MLGRHRLLTLTGPGGVGKTRLAVETARRILDGDSDAPDAVWLVELAGLTDGRLIALAVLGTLGLAERLRLDSDGPPHLAVGAADAADRLVAALERHRSAAAGALEGLAALAAAKGDPERAAKLLGAAVAARRSAGVPLSPGDRVDVERTAARARETFGEERFARALACGEALPLREAIALAEQSLAKPAP